MPNIDLRQCKPGDVLVSQHGRIYIYESYTPNGAYPHLITDLRTGGYGSRLDNGQVYKHLRSPFDNDITEWVRPKSPLKFPIT